MAGERWLFTKSQLSNTPSRKSGLDSDKELSYRQQAANFIQDMGQRLQVNQLCINTAIVYMHRFYMFHSFVRFHRNSIAAASLFLGAKVEEQPRKLEHVITVAHKCLNRESPPLDTKSEAYLEQAQELVINEGILLQTLGFEIKVDHPHTHVVKTCDLVRASKDLAQTSYFLATNSLHLTTLCLQTKPTVVACVCIHLACKWSNWEIPRSSEGKDWFWYVDKHVSLETLEGFTQEFLTILDNCPSRLKKKIMARKDQPPEKRPRINIPTAAGSAETQTTSSHPIDKHGRPDHSSTPGMSKSVTSTPVGRTSHPQPSTPTVDARKKVKTETTPTTTSYKEYKERKERERLAAAASSGEPRTSQSAPDQRTSRVKPEPLFAGDISQQRSVKIDPLSSVELVLQRAVKSEALSLPSEHQRLPIAKQDLHSLPELDHQRSRAMKTEHLSSLTLEKLSKSDFNKNPSSSTKSYNNPSSQREGHRSDAQDGSQHQQSSSHHRHKHSHKSRESKEKDSKHDRPGGQPPIKLKLSNRLSHSGSNGNKSDSRSHSSSKFSHRQQQQVQSSGQSEMAQFSSPSETVSQIQQGDNRNRNSSLYGHTGGGGTTGQETKLEQRISSMTSPTVAGFSQSSRTQVAAYRDSPDLNPHSLSSGFPSQQTAWQSSTYNQGNFVSDLSSVGISASPVKPRKRGPSPASQSRHSPYKLPKKDSHDSGMFGSQMFTPPSLESADFKSTLGEYRMFANDIGNPEANGSDTGSPHIPAATPSQETVNVNALQMKIQQLIELHKTQIARKQQDTSVSGYTSSSSGGYLSDPVMPPLPNQELPPPLPATPPNVPPPPPPPPPPPSF